MITGNSWFQSSWAIRWELKVVSVLVQHKLPIILTVSRAKPLLAYVDHGRWIVRCECGGAELAWEEGLMLCHSCFNSKQRQQLRRTKFPPNRQAIEVLLMKRPYENRNWFPYETLNDLETENLAHKKELLEV
ncbi:hypothetical protein CMI37_08445 [Candidatus Pacearchaeota archaeon]|nr:hypothetical protein [Candidatus Pacearchaeota archaeon]|tara:strand:+ start:15608 stop:16003 length:396 start_codon:yes stop_codon:yes gene_type:complete